MQRLIQSEIPSRLIGSLVSLAGHALLIGAVYIAGNGFVSSASAEELVQPPSGKQARATYADAEQARINAVLHGPRYADDAENISASESFADRALKLYAARAASKPPVVAAQPSLAPTLASVN